MMKGKCNNVVVAIFISMILLTWNVLLASSSSELTVQDHAYDSSTDISDGNNRDLQNGIINAACNLVSLILPGDIQCDCAISLGFIFVCAFQSPLCLGPDQTGYCSFPTLQGDVRILRRTIAFQFCLEDATNNGVPTSGLCFDIGGILDEEDANSFDLQQQQEQQKAKPSSNNNKAVTQVSSKFMSLLSSLKGLLSQQQQQSETSKITDCTGTSEDGKVQCNSCQICNTADSGGYGYTFDCSNINELLVQTTCTPLSIITNLQNPNQDITFFPQFDFEV